ncbi:hypothetical protein AAG596_01100 [Citromicrobium bathyomarinum]
MLLGGFAFSHQGDGRVSSKVFHFRLSDHQIPAVRQRAGELSIGKFAARLVVDPSNHHRISERRAMAKTIRAIHLAIARGLPKNEIEEVDTLLLEALALLQLDGSGSHGGDRS